ncbi:MAG: hypothetical protein ACOH1Y_15370 [Propionicimonas sp.]
MSVSSRVITPVWLLLAGTVLLTGCGSPSTTTTTATPTDSSTSAPSTPATAPSGVPSGLPSDLAAQFAKIQQCLDAAGISLPTPSLPAGASPGGRFTPPAGGIPGGAGSSLNDPKVKAALDACGMALPTGPPSGAPAPTATST